MGRELRRVPPNWQHPQEEKYNPRTGKTELRYTPLYDQSSEEAWEEWRREFDKWIGGEHDRVAAEYGESECPKDQPYWSFCEWHGQPPDPHSHRPHWPKDAATWYQVYETVSEGTPVTPPFATCEELIDYLVANGDFWDQQRRLEGCTSMPCAPWTRKQAEAFVLGPGWAPSLVVSAKGVQSGVEALADEN